MRTKQTDKALKKIGDKLTKLRIAEGYPNRVDFSRAYKLPPIQYWRIEKGRANITIDSLVKILAIYRLSVGDFFKDFE